jgi:hypothetical protein
MRKAALALRLVAAVGCGRGGGSVPASSASAQSAAAGVTSAPGASAKAFRELAASSNANPYKVTYKVSSSAGSAISGTQTWYVSGSRFRMDLTVSASAQGPTSLSYVVIPEGTFSCVSGAGTAAQCFGVAGAQALAQSPGAAFDEQLRANPDAYGATFSGTRQIAGQSASCYGLSGTSVGFTQATICYTSTGVPLLYQLDASGLSVTMEATSFSVPIDADFALPAPAQQVPGGSPIPTRP